MPTSLLARPDEPRTPQSPTPTFEAPQRFDVHRCGDLLRWADGQIALGATRLAVDCRRVRFLDAWARAAMDEVRSRGVEVRVVSPSLATRITYSLLTEGSADVDGRFLVEAA